MSPGEGKGAANDFPGCTDDPQHGLLVSGLAHRTEMPKDSIDSVAAQSQFLPLTLLLLSRLCESVWQNQLQCHYASCTTKLQVRNRLLVLCSSEGTVPAKNQLRPSGASSFALLSIVTERKKNRKRNYTNIHDAALTTWHHWPINVQHAIPIPRAGKVSTYSLRTLQLVLRCYGQVCQPSEAYCCHAEKKGLSITILRDNFHLLTQNYHVIANLSKHFVTTSERAKGLESDCNGQPQVSSKLAFRLD